mgnify:CR=1 FL=1
MHFSHSERNGNDFSQVGRIRGKLREIEFLHRVVNMRTERNNKVLGKVISVSLTVGKALK